METRCGGGDDEFHHKSCEELRDRIKGELGHVFGGKIPEIQIRDI